MAPITKGVNKKACYEGQQLETLRKSISSKISKMPDLYEVNICTNGTTFIVLFPIKYIPACEDTSSTSNVQASSGLSPVFKISYQKRPHTLEGVLKCGPPNHIIHVQDSASQVVCHGLSSTMNITSVYADLVLPRPRSNWYWKCKLDLLRRMTRHNRTSCKKRQMKSPTTRPLNLALGADDISQSLACSVYSGQESAQQTSKGNSSSTDLPASSGCHAIGIPDFEQILQDLDVARAIRNLSRLCDKRSAEPQQSGSPGQQPEQPEKTRPQRSAE